MEEVLSFSITLIIVMNITFIYLLHLKDQTTLIKTLINQNFQKKTQEI
jgi:hypothetical protein